jgi:hypothetical protein
MHGLVRPAWSSHARASSTSMRGSHVGQRRGTVSPEAHRRRSAQVLTSRSDTWVGAPALPLWPMPSAPSAALPSRRAYPWATAALPVLSHISARPCSLPSVGQPRYAAPQGRFRTLQRPSVGASALSVLASFHHGALRIGRGTARSTHTPAVLRLRAGQACAVKGTSRPLVRCFVRSPAEAVSGAVPTPSGRLPVLPSPHTFHSKGAEETGAHAIKRPHRPWPEAVVIFPR